MNRKSEVEILDTFNEYAITNSYHVPIPMTYLSLYARCANLSWSRYDMERRLPVEQNENRLGITTIHISQEEYPFLGEPQTNWNYFFHKNAF